MEGFVGGALATFLFALFFTWLCGEVELYNWKHLMLCPVDGMGTTIKECDTEAVAGGIFRREPIIACTGVLGWVARTLLPGSAAMAIRVSQAQLHACIMGLFASFIAPFGGFFASGFKRAFKIKDFSSVIPGHGGFTDRFDCQLIMGAFAYVYYHYYITGPEAGGRASSAVETLYYSIRRSLGREDIGRLVAMLQGDL